ncbi:unnamed protein product [Haemonchus placei]|uniref:Uncharacterized protein n=1 Tax=Haemonchus placei TaxID=6290 RepID=A0A3P7SSC1_HAEPC|nr:unnamed protein product [Haemonchus placei]
MLYNRIHLIIKNISCLLSISTLYSRLSIQIAIGVVLGIGRLPIRYLRA